MYKTPMAVESVSGVESRSHGSIFQWICNNIMIIIISHISVLLVLFSSVQFISVTQSCPTLCDAMNRSMPGLPLHHKLLEFTQTHVH